MHRAAAGVAASPGVLLPLHSEGRLLDIAVATAMGCSVRYCTDYRGQIGDVTCECEDFHHSFNPGGDNPRTLQFFSDTGAGLQALLDWLNGIEYCKGRLTWSYYHGWHASIAAPDPLNHVESPLRRDVSLAWGESPAVAVANAILYATREVEP